MFWDVSLGVEVAEVFGIFTIFHLSVRRLYIFL